MLPLRPIPFFRVDFLGIYPDAFSLVPQLPFALCPLIYFFVIKRDGNAAAPSVPGAAAPSPRRARADGRTAVGGKNVARTGRSNCCSPRRASPPPGALGLPPRRWWTAAGRGRAPAPRPPSARLAHRARRPGRPAHPPAAPARGALRVAVAGAARPSGPGAAGGGHGKPQGPATPRARWTWAGAGARLPRPGPGHRGRRRRAGLGPRPTRRPPRHRHHRPGQPPLAGGGPAPGDAPGGSA